MKEYRLKIKTEIDNCVHYAGAFNEMTLCGLETLGDTTESIEPAIETYKKADCPQCLQIVQRVREIMIDIGEIQESPNADD